jgi:hypothetical protein
MQVWGKCMGQEILAYPLYLLKEVSHVCWLVARGNTAEAFFVYARIPTRWNIMTLLAAPTVAGISVWYLQDQTQPSDPLNKDAWRIPVYLVNERIIALESKVLQQDVKLAELQRANGWLTAERGQQGGVNHNNVDVDDGCEFQAAAEFCGTKAGFVFKTGTKGLGYYRDRSEF